jgi:hypothetical protein
MPRKKSEAFDVKLTDDERTQLTADLCREVEDAIQMRQLITGAGGIIDLLDWFYEQGRSDPRDRPFQGAADLTSTIITETVDTLRAQLMQAVFSVEPFCAVDGWGEAAQRAPFAEEFHEWQVHETGLPLELGKVVHGGLIEDCCILEVRERVETRRVVEEIDVLPVVDEQGRVVFGPDNQPELQMDADNEPVPSSPEQPGVKVKRTYTKTKRLGPEYECISMKDFGFLPGHAKNTRQVWGYYKRTHARVPELKEKVEDGIYDRQAVAEMGDDSNRESESAGPSVSGVASQTGPSAEKELFELSLKRDLDKDGREEWYVVTLSVFHRQILRLKLDTFVMRVGKSRCVPLVLFPRRNSVYGYSFAGDKLLTSSEEDTALRNMKADRGALATNAPMTVERGAHFNPDEQPFGVGRFLQVNRHDEIRQLEIADVPNSIVEQERNILMRKERVSGVSDMTMGVQAGERRTLGENKMVFQGSAVRVNEALGHFRTFISHVMDLVHQVWLDTLESDTKGLEAPQGVMSALETRGQELEGGRFTSQQLKGPFRFKPYGSVETATPEWRESNFNNSTIGLVNLGKVSQPLAMVLQDWDVAKGLFEEWMRTYKIRNRGPFMQAFMRAQQQQQMMQAMQQALPQGAGMAPGAPMGEGPVPGGPNGDVPPGAPPRPPGPPPPEIAGIMQALGIQ